MKKCIAAFFELAKAIPVPCVRSINPENKLFYRLGDCANTAHTPEILMAFFSAYIAIPFGIYKATSEYQKAKGPIPRGETLAQYKTRLEAETNCRHFKRVYNRRLRYPKGTGSLSAKSKEIGAHSLKTCDALDAFSQSMRHEMNRRKELQFGNLRFYGLRKDGGFHDTGSVESDVEETSIKASSHESTKEIEAFYESVFNVKFNRP